MWGRWWCCWRPIHTSFCDNAILHYVGNSIEVQCQVRPMENIQVATVCDCMEWNEKECITSSTTADEPVRLQPRAVEHVSKKKFLDQTRTITGYNMIMVSSRCIIEDVFCHRLTKNVGTNAPILSHPAHLASFLERFVTRAHNRGIIELQQTLASKNSCNIAGPTQNMIQARCSRIAKGMLANIHFSVSEYGICGLDVLFSCWIIEHETKNLTRMVNQVGVRMKLTTSTDGSSDIDGINCALVVCHNQLPAHKSLCDSPGRGISNHCNTLILHIYRAWPLCGVKRSPLKLPNSRDLVWNLWDLQNASGRYHDVSHARHSLAWKDVFHDDGVLLFGIIPLGR